MRMGIIGAGHVGGTLGRLFESQGHDVRFGVRDPARSRAADFRMRAPEPLPMSPPSRT